MSKEMDNHRQRQLSTVMKESRNVEFKEQFDVQSSRDWAELCKDVVAMANSGGGQIWFGVKDDGSSSELDIAGLLSLDPADAVNKFTKYMGEQVPDIKFTTEERAGHTTVVWNVAAVSVPIVFSKPGEYDRGDGKMKQVFAQGTVYFRHGAKSEPGSTVDLRKAFDREIERQHRDWARNVRKVVKAPVGALVQVVPRRQAAQVEAVESSQRGAMLVRLTDDPRAPAYRRRDPNFTHPHRQKDVVKHFNRRFVGRKAINAHDVLVVRRAHKIGDETPEYYYKPTYTSPTYSQEFIDWLETEFEKDPMLFDKAKEQAKAIG